MGWPTVTNPNPSSVVIDTSFVSKAGSGIINGQQQTNSKPAPLPSLASSSLVSTTSVAPTSTTPVATATQLTTAVPSLASTTPALSQLPSPTPTKRKCKK
jgi:hypothetical protein